MSTDMIWNIVVMVPPLIVAVVLHEVAHGYIAERLGDPTARTLGRISLNPIVHIDFFMTILLPLLLILSQIGIVFGGAKPVPVNPHYFRDPRRGMLWVALAGPVTNFILALVSYLLFFLYQNSSFISWLPLMVAVLLAHWLAYSILINLVLGLFNLLPVPPLDGGRILVGILPVALAAQVARLERYGILVVIGLIYFGIPQAVLEPVIEFVALCLGS